MAYSRDEAFETHKDYKENVNQWEYLLDHLMVVMIIHSVNT